MLIAEVTNIDVVGWACFLVGLVVLGCGVYVGLTRKAPVTTDTAKDRLKQADQKLDEARAHLATAKAAVADPAGGQAAAVGASAEAAQTALEQVQGIVASLPETLRFAGLLVLIGTVLMGVATVQFGGVSLF